MLRPVPDLPGLRLYQAADVTTLWRLTAEALGSADPPLPYWAFGWSGGLALARYLEDHRDEVAGRAVVDIASGSGLCAIIAARAGASSVLAIDVDPFAAAAIELNASANGVRVAVRTTDVLDDEPSDCNVLLAGDVWYEEPMAARMLPWLQRAARRGIRVLVGDPGRAYLPPGLEPLATYRVRASREIEEAESKASTVYVLRP